MTVGDSWGIVGIKVEDWAWPVKIPIDVTLGEIESAIERLPASQVEKLALWLEQHRARKPATSVSEPDFLGRAKGIWGETPAGEPLSALVSQARD